MHTWEGIHFKKNISAINCIGIAVANDALDGLDHFGDEISGLGL
jgi:hypothetical protein